ncbi:hypothetical protein N5P37_003226 [Trichoderma harzianum]|nr:hypothetical protein N5P37_003226 [Trichoderma harzianum]
MHRVGKGQIAARHGLAGRPVPTADGAFFFHRALQTRSSGDIDPVDAIGGDDTMRLSFCLGARVGAVANEVSNVWVQLIPRSRSRCSKRTENKSMHAFSPLLPFSHGSDLIMSDLTIRQISLGSNKSRFKSRTVCREIKEQEQTPDISLVPIRNEMHHTQLFV